jgi:HTH-type transcriptional regulator, competence development regulator
MTITTTNGTLAERLKEARRTKGMTLREVERRTGIDNAHLSQIENGRIAKPEVAMLWSLAGVYELDYAELIASTEPESQPRTSAAHRRRIAAAMRAMGDMSPNEQLDVLNFMTEVRRRKTGG